MSSNKEVLVLVESPNIMQIFTNNAASQQTISFSGFSFNECYAKISETGEYILLYSPALS